MRLYEAIAIANQAHENCIASGNLEWAEIWDTRLSFIERNLLPSGSGFDNGTTIDRGATNDKRLTIHTAFHHMNGGGYYDGWTEHSVIVTPSLASRINMRVTGRNRDEIKDYVGDTFHNALTGEVTWNDLDGKGGDSPSDA